MPPAKEPSGEVEKARERIAELERKIGQQQVELDFFRQALRQVEGARRPSDGPGATRVYAVIQAMTTPLPQGELTIERMCALAGVSRAGYYRHWQASAPRAGGDRACATRSSAWRWRSGITATAGSRRSCGETGLAVNHKRVLRLMREDNLLCLRGAAFVPVTTDSRHGWRVVPNLARGLVLTGIDQLWVADITYIRLHEEFAYLAVVLDAFSRRVDRLGTGDASAGEPGDRGARHGARGAPARRRAA